MKRFTLLLFFAFSFLSESAYSQFYVVPAAPAPSPFEPLTLVENVFLGDGVDVLGINWTGNMGAIGFFDDGLGAIGIEQGIVLSTGLAFEAVAANNLPVNGSIGNNASTSFNDPGGDPDLVATTSLTNNVRDNIIIEIDFIPAADTIRFEYVFASEEYNEWVGSQFNDVFGFYLSGPGINGPYTNNAENLAVVPGTNIPITISTINNNANSSYYIDNENNGGSTFEYDGHTVVMIAEAIVIPCQQYKMKIALGDGTDNILDSGVFLKAKSFGTSVALADASTPSFDATVAEGCEPAYLNFSLGEPAEDDFYINYTIAGTAINGIDYSFIPDSIFIPQGQTTVSFPFIAYLDTLTEGVEYISFIVQIDLCTTDTFEVFIDDNRLVPPDSLIGDTTICAGDTVQLNGTVPVYIPEPTTFEVDSNIVLLDTTDYLWPIQVSGIYPEIVSPGLITSICIDIQKQTTHQLDIFVISPSGAVMLLSSDNGGGNGGNNYYGTCFTPYANIAIDSVPPCTTPPLCPNFTPFTGNWLPEDPWSELYGSDSNGTWYLRVVHDQGGGSPANLLGWSISFAGSYNIFYEWTPDYNVSCVDCPITEVYPTVDTTYYLQVSDVYGCFQVLDSVEVSVVEYLDPPMVTCDVITSNSINFVWPAVLNATSYEVNVGGTGWVPANPGPLSHLVTGLLPNDTAIIEVRGVDGQCNNPGLIGLDTCYTFSCSHSVTVDTVLSVSCFGGNNGSVQVSVMGGNPPFSYILDNTVTQAFGVFSNLIAGPHFIDVIDADSCVITANFIVPEPDSLYSVSSIIPVSCSGGGGVGIVTPVGGTAPYIYNWNTVPTQTDSIASNLPPGTYICTIIDNNICIAFDTVVIEIPDPLAVLLNSTETYCLGSSDGSTSVQVVGGTAPYSYLWDEGTTPTDSATGGLSSGFHTVTVTDTLGCVIIDSIMVNEPSGVTTVVQDIAPSCSGFDDGSAIVVAFGGSGVYTYEWTAIPSGVVLDTFATQDSIGEGDYQVMVTDSNGCSVFDTITLTAPNSISTTMTVNSHVSCNGGSDGSATLSASGGVGQLSYLWNTVPAQTDSTAIGLMAGNYEVTVSDANGCFSINPVTIDEPNALTSTMDTVPNVCFGDSLGSAQVNPIGGTAPYSYIWSDATGTTNQQVNNLPIGVYQVTVTDSLNCVLVDTVEIFEPTEMILSITVDSPSCHGATDGLMTCIAIGGTTPYSYLWFDGSTASSTNSGVTFGFACVTVTDGNGCEAVACSQVFQPDSMFTISSVSNDVLCFGESNGIATFEIGGGTSPYDYVWDNGELTNTADSLDAGLHTLTVTDANGCIYTDTVTINQPTILMSTTGGDSVSCNAGLDGVVWVNVTGGAGGVSCVWGNGFVGDTLTTLPAGLHYVTCTDVNGCIIVDSVEIFEPSVLTITMDSLDVACFGDSTGQTSVVASGGVAPYTYQWDDYATQTTSTASNLLIGTYVVTVTDNNGCTIVGSTSVGQLSAMSLNTGHQIISCWGGDDGKAWVEATGGTGNYNYVWSDLLSQTTDTAFGLTTGMYYVSVSDDNGCINVDSVFVTEPGAPLSSNTGVDSVTCFAGTDGQASVTVVGGTGTYTYLWNDPMGQISDIATGLSSGQYIVTITDQKGCTLTDTVNIDEPAALTIVLDSMPSGCSGGSSGSAIVNPIGGVGNYSYTWDDALGQNTSVAGNLIAGIYSVTVTDGNGCTVTGSTEVIEPAPMASTTSSNPADCFGDNSGLMWVEATGGIGDYDYQWSVNSQNNDTLYNVNSGTYQVTVTDDNGCTIVDTIEVDQPTELVIDSISPINILCKGGNDGVATVHYSGGNGLYSIIWSDPLAQTSNTANGLLAGTYVVTVSDAKGCIVTETVTINEPADSLKANINLLADVSCFGLNNGSAYISGNGGTAPYSYEWNDVLSQTGSTAIGLPSGMFNVTVTDANGCTFVSSDVEVEEPAELSLTTAVIRSSCFEGNDGQASVIVSGGTPSSLPPPFDYTYEWVGTGLATDIAQGLIGGETYTLNVTDVNGCSASTTVTIPQPDPLTFFASSDTTSCYDDDNGAIWMDSVSGGTPGYTFEIPNSGTYTASDTIPNLAAGTYFVTMTDLEGCTLTKEVTVNQPNVLRTQLITTNIDCYGETSGVLLAQTAGGSGTYSAEWSNGVTGIGNENLVAGTYSVTITDGNGCSTVEEGTITEPDEPLEANYEVDVSTCYQGNDGRIEVSPEGGVAPYKYSIENEGFVGSPIFLGLQPGDYDIEVVDANGCSVLLDAVVVNDPIPLEVDLGPDLFIDLGDSIELLAIPNVPPSVELSYEWFEIGPGTIKCDTCALTFVEPENQNQYVVIITNEDGCTASDTISVEVVRNRTIFVATGFTPNQDNINEKLFVQGPEGTLVRKFRVFDRWGELVYESLDGAINDPNLGWDGTYDGALLNQGIFTWYAEVEFIDGEIELVYGSTLLLK